MQTLFVGPEHAQSLSFIPVGEQPVADAHFTREENAPLTKQGGGQPFNRLFYFRMKRLLDLTLTLFALGLLWPLLLLIAIAIKLDSPGPIFVAQERVGVRRRRHQNRLAWEQTRFRLYKFRTTVATDKQPPVAKRNVAYQSPYSSDAMARHTVTIEPNADRAVTPVGRFLQQTCLDQLPQLWNILSGELTLVGPRPALPAELPQYAPSDLRRFETLPGMTGLWQLREPCLEQYHRTKAERERQRVMCFAQMVQTDLDYIEQQSLGLDLRILGNTLLAALRLQTPSA